MVQNAGFRVQNWDKRDPVEGGHDSGLGLRVVGLWLSHKETRNRVGDSGIQLEKPGSEMGGVAWRVWRMGLSVARCRHEECDVQKVEVGDVKLRGKGADTMCRWRRGAGRPPSGRRLHQSEGPSGTPCLLVLPPGPPPRESPRDGRRERHQSKSPGRQRHLPRLVRPTWLRNDPPSTQWLKKGVSPDGLNVDQSRLSIGVRYGGAKC